MTRVVPSERCSVSVRTSVNSPLREVKTIARAGSTGQPCTNNVGDSNAVIWESVRAGCRILVLWLADVQKKLQVPTVNWLCIQCFYQDTMDQDLRRQTRMLQKALTINPVNKFSWPDKL